MSRKILGAICLAAIPVAYFVRIISNAMSVSKTLWNADVIRTLFGLFDHGAIKIGAIAIFFCISLLLWATLRGLYRMGSGIKASQPRSA